MVNSIFNIIFFTVFLETLAILLILKEIEMYPPPSDLRKPWPPGRWGLQAQFYRLSQS